MVLLIWEPTETVKTLKIFGVYNWSKKNLDSNV